MSNYRIYRTSEFKKQISKCTSDFKNKLSNIEKQLEISPYVGKPLNNKWFREKKIGSYRVYYLIFENYKTVVLLGHSTKKDQQQTIDTIRKFLHKYKKELEDII